jgi:hypothetical protein
MWPSKSGSSERPSLRSGVAVRPRRSRGPDLLDVCLVGGGRDVVALVDHDVVPVVGAQSLEQTPRVEALHRREKVIVAERLATTDEELAKGLIA